MKTHLEAADPTATAVALVEQFLHERLPAVMRWAHKRQAHGSGRLREARDDVGQDLRLDAVVHAREIVALPEEERTRRWYRLADRLLHRTLARPERELPALPLADRRPSGAWSKAAPMPWADAERAMLHNGRLCLSALALAHGADRRAVRARWSRAATALGAGDDYASFWKRRLAEAFTGLAADLLRDRELVHVLPRRRMAPDPRGRLRRIERIRSALSVRPSDRLLRTCFALVRKRKSGGWPPPAMLLELAQTLWPEWPDAALWRAEAAIAAEDPAAAIAALRRARRLGADATAIALGRARVLALRGNEGAAAALLQRLRRRRPGDPRPQMALGAGPQGLSACCNASPSASSSRSSGRGRVQSGCESNQPIAR